MSGFHLTGLGTGPVIEQTIAALREIDPDYIIPTHCTGRNAVMKMEQAMPEKFILNMSCTNLTFAA
jgi:7,8-dihydropterin-6-yl-methyl-4-(beta-D-ribofuranosyl)aminobenzene 5'-phosphate synthase